MPRRHGWRWVLAVASVLLVLSGGVGVYGYQQNWDRYIHYRRLPGQQVHVEQQLIAQLSQPPVTTPQAAPGALAGVLPFSAPAGAVRATPATGTSRAEAAVTSDSQVQRTSPAATLQATPAAPAIDYAGLPNGRVTDLQIFSPVLNKTFRYRIYLPPGYDDPRLANARYPVVYLLHGAPGGHHDWVDGASANQVADAMIKTRTISPVILIMPDGSLGDPHHDTQWGNSPVTGERVEDALVQDLVPAIDLTYRTIPLAGARGIGGLSSGGYGALNIGLHHPETFSTIFSLSGYYTPDKTYDGRDLWGSDQAHMLNNPTAQANGQPVHIFIGEGQADHEHLAEARTFEQVLTRHGMDHDLEIYPGNHTWDFWRDHLVDSLRYSFHYLQPATNAGSTTS